VVALLLQAASAIATVAVAPRVSRESKEASPNVADASMVRRADEGLVKRRLSLAYCCATG
jgi:hypothetical protein